MFVIVSKYLIPKGYRGLTAFPFIFLKYHLDKNDLVIINHEKIHLKQQVELLVIPFFIWYFIEFLIRFLQYKKFDLAYHNISFEREAYANEKDFNYLKIRKLYSFFNYLKMEKKS